MSPFSRRELVWLLEWCGDDVLTEREQLVVRAYYGIDVPRLTLREIGLRLENGNYGRSHRQAGEPRPYEKYVSREQVRVIRNGAFHRLRDHLRTRGRLVPGAPGDTMPRPRVRMASSYQPSEEGLR